MLIVTKQSGNRALHNKVASGLFAAGNENNTASDRTGLVDVLSELRNLLEDYSPVWYTEEHQRRLESALRWAAL